MFDSPIALRLLGSRHTVLGRPNHPAPGKAGIARPLAIAQHRPGLPELGRWAVTQQGAI